MAGILKTFQDYVDNNQAAINSLDQYNPLRWGAQKVQDIANAVAHPVKTGKEAVKATEQTLKQAAQDPKKALTELAKEAVGINEYKKLAQDPKLYAAQKVGGGLGDLTLMAATAGGIGTAATKGAVSKGITKAVPKQYPTSSVIKGSDFSGAKPLLKNIEDLKKVEVPKSQIVKEQLTDINSLKKATPAKSKTINEQLYDMKTGDLRKAPSDVEQLYLEQYRKYPAEMLEANPVRSTNTKLLTDWAEGLVGKEGYGQGLRDQIAQRLTVNSSKIPMLNMGDEAGRVFNREVFRGADPYDLYNSAMDFRRGTTLGMYSPMHDTIDIANKRYAQAIIDKTGVNVLPEVTYPHEVTHKVLASLENEALKNPSNTKLSDKLKEMLTNAGGEAGSLGGNENFSNALPAALNPKYQSPRAPYYGSGTLNNMQLLRDTENWWRKELSPYALKKEESLFKGSNLATPQNKPDSSLSDFMKILDDEQYLRRMEDL